MNKYYDEDMLEQINESVDLVEYASTVMDLKKKGREYFANCPLHKDNTPSLSFTSTTNKYYCFSCGAGGSVINFLIDFEGLNFHEAVEKAMKLANMDENTFCKSETINFLKSIRGICRYTVVSEPIKPVFYQHKVLDKKDYDRKYKHEPIKEWLDEGITQEVLDLFEVRADTFQSRIVYPVYSIRGDLINVKGRTRNPNFKLLKIPKYINYYPVGCVDYFQGMNITLSDIKDKNEVIIFESVKSVMKAYGWGIKNCVSAEKHTLTNEQISILVKLRVDVVLAFDTDVNYNSPDVKRSIDKLKRLTNVYIIKDKDNLLGGKEAKNSPADCGEEVFNRLYQNKKKVR